MPRKEERDGSQRPELILRQYYSIEGVFPGGKGGRCIRLTTVLPSPAVVMKSGNLNFLEPSGPFEACNGTALPFNFILALIRMDWLTLLETLRSVSDVDLKWGLPEYKIGVRFQAESETGIVFCRESNPPRDYPVTQTLRTAFVNWPVYESVRPSRLTFLGALPAFPLTSSCPDAEHFKKNKKFGYISYRAVNTLRLGYKNQSVNSVQRNNDCLLWDPYRCKIS